MTYLSNIFSSKNIKESSVIFVTKTETKAKMIFLIRENDNKSD